MGVKAEGSARVGTEPETKVIPGGDEARHLTTFRAYFDGSVKTESGYEDRYGFWRTIEVWAPGLSARVAAHVKKGMVVNIKGTEQRKTWDKDGTEMEEYVIKADHVAIDLVGIESITMQPKKTAATETEGAKSAETADA